MRHVALFAALVFPALAWADVAPGGDCKCQTGAPSGAAVLVVVGAALIRRARP